MTEREVLRALKVTVDAIQVYADRCQLYGPADHLRDAIRRAVLQVAELDALLTAGAAQCPVRDCGKAKRLDADVCEDCQRAWDNAVAALTKHAPPPGQDGPR